MKNYSGKKKMHTRKNLIISNKNRRIGYLSPTVEGKRHDYGMFKDIWPPLVGKSQENTTFWLDLGFKGIENDYPDLNVVMPKKKPRGKELTDQEKVKNKIISGFRVIIEHAICGIKRFRITTDKFRNRRIGFDDTVMLLSCGLWDYHLKYG